ncbi:hypothetical protein GCM10028807_49890 [Spirosoma daeguense]
MLKDILMLLVLLYILYRLKAQQDALNGQKEALAKLGAQWQKDVPSLETIYKA